MGDVLPETFKPSNQKPSNPPTRNLQTLKPFFIRQTTTIRQSASILSDSWNAAQSTYFCTLFAVNRSCSGKAKHFATKKIYLLL
jgi:hypothetical protein